MKEARIAPDAAHAGGPHLARGPEPAEYAPYYHRYVERVPAGDIARTLEQSARETVALLRSEPARERSDFRYAAGKWSVKEVLGHVCDAERVFTYRMLRFGRGDSTPLESFDENIYAPAGEFEQRKLDDIVEEFLAVRTATLALVRGLPESAWTRSGMASGQEVSVRALAWIIAGHEMHHRALLEERYLDIAGEPGT